MKEFVKPVLIQYLSLFILMIFSVLQARILGPENKGFLTLLIVPINLIIMIGNLGIKQSIAYAIGNKLISKKISIYIIFIFSNIAGLIYILFYIILILIINIETEMINVLLISLNIYFILFNNLFSGIELGKSNYNFIYYSNNIKNTTLLLLLLIFINYYNFQLAIIIYTVSNFSIFLYTTYKYRKTIIYKNLLNIILFLKNNLNILLNLIKKGILYCFALLLLNINYRIDIIISSIYVSNFDIGLYSAATSLCEVFWQLPIVIGIVIFSTSFKKDSKEVIKLIKMSFLISPILIIIMWIIFPSLIIFLLGDDYYRSINITRVLIIGIILSLNINIIYPYLAAKGYQLYGVIIFLFTAIINIVLNLIFIPKYGILAAAYTSGITYVLSTILLIIIFYYLIRRKFI